MGVKSPFFRRWFGDWREFDKTLTKVIKLTSKSPTKRGNVINKDTGFEINVSRIGIDHIRKHLHNREISDYILSHLDEITKNAILLDDFISEPTGQTKHKNTMLMHSFYAPIIFNNKSFVVKLYVEEYYNEWNDSIQKRNYDLSTIESITNGIEVRENNLAPLDAFGNASKIRVSNLFNFVKTYDKDFNPEPCSAILGEDGTPKVVYHGTKDYGFIAFDTSKSDDLTTLFFADSPELASTYSGKEGVTNKNSIKSAENLSPAEMVEELNRLRDVDDEELQTIQLFCMK